MYQSEYLYLTALYAYIDGPELNQRTRLVTDTGVNSIFENKYLHLLCKIQPIIYPDILYVAFICVI